MSCTSLRNLQKTGCPFNPEQIYGFIQAPDNTGMTFATALTLAGWEAKMILAEASRFHILMPKAPLSVDVTQEDMVIETGNTNASSFINDGKLTVKLTYDGLTLGEIAALRSYNNVSTYVYTVTQNEIFGGKTSTNFIPVPVKIYVSELRMKADNKTSAKVMVTVEFLNTKGNFDYVVEPTILTAPWYPTIDIEGVTDVLLTAISADVSSKTFIFSAVKYNNNIEEIANISTATDVIVYLVSTGVALTSDSISNVGYIYTLIVAVGTPLTEFPYACRLKTVDLATQKLYETVDNSNAITPAT